MPGGKGTPLSEFTGLLKLWSAGSDPKGLDWSYKPKKDSATSCSTAGRLTFDIGLLGQPAAFRAEAVVHELLHLKVPNHGQLFRSLLRSYLSDR